MPRHGLLLVLCVAGHAAAAQTANSGAQAPPLVRWPEALGFAAITGITFATDARIRATVQGHNSKFRNSVAYVGNAFGYAKNVYPALLLGTVGGKVVGASDLYRVSWRALKSTALARRHHHLCPRARRQALGVRRYRGGGSRHPGRPARPAV